MTTERPLSAVSVALHEELHLQRPACLRRTSGRPDACRFYNALAAIEAESRATAQAEIARGLERSVTLRAITRAYGRLNGAWYDKVAAEALASTPAEGQE